MVDTVLFFFFLFKIFTSTIRRSEIPLYKITGEIKQSLETKIMMDLKPCKGGDGQRLACYLYCKRGVSFTNAYFHLFNPERGRQWGDDT